MVTVSTVPVGRDSVVFQALLPPAAPFGTKLHPISLFGWRGEVASHLSLFRTWTYTPDPSLFIPQPTMRFMALLPGYSLPSLCEGLTQDFQTLDGGLLLLYQTRQYGHILPGHGWAYPFRHSLTKGDLLRWRDTGC